ncbi:MAG: hypothetical protein O6946_02310 [Gammaproteobacteria bacterium]|nr:hypothetical protein [Gammaproteobacteria bacterium]MCZ6715877.1 hypothetical protein [Gammaproteobacteria bacterium]
MNNPGYDPAKDSATLARMKTGPGKVRRDRLNVGALTGANGARLIEAGANMLAVISAVFAVTNSCEAAGDLSMLFEQSPAAAGRCI